LREIRRKEKEVTDEKTIKKILKSTKFVTIAMSLNDEPYLATLSHGYDEEHNCIYFHCAKEGKKIEILNENNLVWGQALIDLGYQAGSCDNLYHSTQFQGRVTFIQDMIEKRHALETMIRQLEDDSELVIDNMIKPESVERVQIGKIDIDYLSSKKSDTPAVEPKSIRF
jgi:nitroimidazol reductase NimA-like FMN-containing flavoprotein (pyridoxamine 5'-phosphate oxidase superfamily)